MENNTNIKILENMGFNKVFIRKVYAFLSPPTLMDAIQYMTINNGKYGHNYLETDEKKNKYCYICGYPQSFHINSNIAKDDDIHKININSGDIMISKDYNNNNKIEIICDICEEKSNNLIKNEECNHSFCYDCWVNYLKEKIQNGMIDKIICMNYSCKKLLPKKFIVSLLKNQPDLISKYEKLLLKMQILNDPNKKFCPFPNCESYAERNPKTKFVKCKNNHKFCFNCLKDHDSKISCDEEIYKDFKIWKKNKIVKQCPRCQFWIERIEGCHQMMCSYCYFCFCWVCLKDWLKNNHYKCTEKDLKLTEEMIKFFKPFNLRTEPETENQFHNIILIENISNNTSLHELTKYLEIYGKVKSVDIPKDKKTGNSKGFAFCEYASDKFAKRAIREKNLVLNGNKLSMKLIDKETKQAYYLNQDKEEKEEERKERAELKKYEVCVKGLPFEDQKKEVYDYFHKFGEIINYLWLENKGIFFCIYKSKKVAQNLVQKGSLNYKGKIVTVKYSKDKKEPKKYDNNNFKEKYDLKKHELNNSSKPSQKIENKNNRYTLFVGNLNYKTTEESLEKFFQECGVVSVRIGRGQGGRSKGFGFVDFDNIDNLNKALLKNGKILDSRPLRINVENID